MQLPPGLSDEIMDNALSDCLAKYSHTNNILNSLFGFGRCDIVNPQKTVPNTLPGCHKGNL